MIQYSVLVRRIKSEALRNGLCRCPKMNVVVLLSKKGDNGEGADVSLKAFVKYKNIGSGTK